MNYLLLFIILVLVVCLMNSKDLMKSVSTKTKSLKMDNTTTLVLGFVVIVLFMCMSKSVEGFKMVETDTDISEDDVRFTGICSRGSSIKKILNGPMDPSNDSITRASGVIGAHPYVQEGTPLYDGVVVPAVDYNNNGQPRYLYGCLVNGGNRNNHASWTTLTGGVVEASDANMASPYCIEAHDSVGTNPHEKLCGRFPNSNCVGEWTKCDANCEKTYNVISDARGTGTCPHIQGEIGTCNFNEGLCEEPQDCIGGFTPTTCGEDCGIRTYNITTVASGGGVKCPYLDGHILQCKPGDGSCPLNIDCVGSWGDCQADCYKYYDITTESSGDGNACPYAAEDKQRCRHGQGACKSAKQIIDDAAKAAGKAIGHDLVKILVAIVKKHASLPIECGGNTCPPKDAPPHIGECYDPTADPSVCSSNSGNCPPGQINCSGKGNLDFEEILRNFINNNNSTFKKISGLPNLRRLTHDSSEDDAHNGICSIIKHFEPDNPCNDNLYDLVIHLKNLLKSHNK